LERNSLPSRGFYDNILEKKMIIWKGLIKDDEEGKEYTPF
jgi:hypothetical protein